MVGWEKDPGFTLGMPHFLPQRSWMRTGWGVVLQGCLCRRLGSTNLYCIIFMCTATPIVFTFHTKLTENWHLRKLENGMSSLQTGVRSSRSVSLVICLGLGLHIVEVGFMNTVKTVQLNPLSGRKEAIVALVAFWTCFSEDFSLAGS